MARVLIGCPTCERYEYCIDNWIDAVKKIIEFSKFQVDYLLVDNSKENNFFEKMRQKGINIIKSEFKENVKQRIVDSRNILREKALDEGYDYFFSLEQDVIPNEDILQRWISFDKKIISAYYSKQQDLIVKDKETNEIKKARIDLPIVWLADEKGIGRAFPQEVLNKGLIKVAAFGVGCVLISSEVLKKIKFRYEPGQKAYDDMYFCLDAKNLGYELFLDSDLRVRHLWKYGDKENL
jgi:GT2 family glycosyltransferase